MRENSPLRTDRSCALSRRVAPAIYFHMKACACVEPFGNVHCTGNFCLLCIFSTCDVNGKRSFFGYVCFVSLLETDRGYAATVRGVRSLTTSQTKCHGVLASPAKNFEHC